MRLTPEQVERFIHLQSIIDRQAIDRETLRRQRDYYDGLHDVLLSPRQRDFLGLLVGQGNDATWSFNLMRNVVDTIRERLCVVGFTVDGETAASEADNATPEGQLADLLGIGGQKTTWTRCRLTSTARRCAMGCPTCS